MRRTILLSINRPLRQTKANGLQTGRKAKIIGLQSILICVTLTCPGGIDEPIFAMAADFIDIMVLMSGGFAG